MNPYLKDISFENPVNLEFIKRLSTPTGILQHTKFAVPDRFEGYCSDDNARALLLVVKDHQLFGKHQALNLAVSYLAYLAHSLREDKFFETYQSFDHRFLGEKSQDAYGRVMWALGHSVRANVRWDITKQAENVFHQASPNLTKLDFIKAKAYSLMGVLEFQQSEAKNDGLEKTARVLADDIADAFEKKATEDWVWFEDTLTYANGLLPTVMLKSGVYFQDDRYLKIGEKSLEFLEKQSRVENKPAPIGSDGWYHKGGKRATWDQQPIDSYQMVMANTMAYRALGKENFKASALEWFAWFHGNNLKKEVMVDLQSGGCFDGLTEEGVNLNQGAESTLAYWLAYLELVDLLGSKK